MPLITGYSTVNRLQSAGSNRPIGYDFQSAPIGWRRQSANRLWWEFGAPYWLLNRPLSPNALAKPSAWSGARARQPNPQITIIGRVCCKTQSTKRLRATIGSIGPKAQSTQPAENTNRPNLLQNPIGQSAQNHNRLNRPRSTTGPTS